MIITLCYIINFITLYTELFLLMITQICPILNVFPLKFHLSLKVEKILLTFISSSIAMERRNDIVRMVTQRLAELLSVSPSEAAHLVSSRGII